MNLLSLEAKEALVLKVINRGSKTVKSIAEAHNIGFSTLQEWMRRYRVGQPLVTEAAKPTKRATLMRAEQFQHIVSTSGLDEVSLGKYCRKHGIYSHQLTEWREFFMNTEAHKNSPKELAEIKKLKEENKRLQRELRRKEKALAEASALLVLKKKADLIWGEDEDN